MVRLNQLLQRLSLFLVVAAIVCGSALAAQSESIRKVYRTGPNEQLPPDQAPSLSLSLHGGDWIPTGRLASYGNHPSLAFNILFGYRYLYWGALFDFRLPTTSPESAADPVYSTVILAALDFRWEFLHPKAISVFLVGGGGFESLSPFSNSARGTPATQAITLSFNAGIAVRKYLNDGRNLFLDVQARYAIPNFSGTGPTGADISGNYLTILAGIGFRFSLLRYY